MIFFHHIQVFGCLGYIAWHYWNVYLEKKDAEARAIQEKLDNFDKPTEAWLKAVAREGLPRCSFCTNAGLGELAIGHYVTDSNGLITCPVLLERNNARKNKDQKKPGVYSSQDADNSVAQVAKGDHGNNKGDHGNNVIPREAAYLDHVEEFLVSDTTMDHIPRIYDPYS